MPTRIPFSGGPLDGTTFDKLGDKQPTRWLRVGAYSEAKKKGMYGLYIYDVGRKTLVWKELPPTEVCSFVGGPRNGRDAAIAHDRPEVRCAEGRYVRQVQADGKNIFLFIPRNK